MSTPPKQKRVYLSGPMTGIPKNNRPAFIEAESVLRKRGFRVLNPARLPDLGTWADNMRRDIPLLCNKKGKRRGCFASA